MGIQKFSLYPIIFETAQQWKNKNQIINCTWRVISNHRPADGPPGHDP